jgi:hypothetical protein
VRIKDDRPGSAPHLAVLNLSISRCIERTGDTRWAAIFVPLVGMDLLR